MKCPLRKNDAFIEKYISNQLSRFQTKRFEKHLFQCPECVEYTMCMQNVIESIQIAGAAGLLEEKVIPANIIRDLRKEVSFVHQLQVFLQDMLHKVAEWMAIISPSHQSRSDMSSGNLLPAYKMYTTYRIVSRGRLDYGTLSVIIAELLDINYTAKFAFQSNLFA